MRYIDLKSMAEIQSIAHPVVLCVGNFDGVHIGHRQLVAAVLKEHNILKDQFTALKTGAWFFDSSFYKNTDPIQSLDEKIGAFASLGLDYAIIAEFDEMKSLSPEDFVNKVLVEECKCVHAVCGENFRFGSRALGDVKILEDLMDGNATIVPLLSEENCVISSTFIRGLLKDGDIVHANHLLSDNYSICEPVVHGKALGRTIGIPTINQNVKSKILLLKNGIYATICTIDNKKYYGVTNVGVRPTVDDSSCKNVETFIIDFNEDCYDKYVKVEFVSRIRDEKKFESINALVKQIQLDIETTKKVFNI